MFFITKTYLFYCKPRGKKVEKQNGKKSRAQKYLTQSDEQKTLEYPFKAFRLSI